MFFRRSAASRRTRSRSALNSSPCTYSLTRFTRASESRSEMISAEVSLKNLLAISLLLPLRLIVPPGGLRDVPDDDTAAGSSTLDAGEVHPELLGPLPGGLCRFRPTASFVVPVVSWTRGIYCLLRCFVRLPWWSQILAEELRIVLQGPQYLAEDRPHIVQAGLELGLGFYAFDLQLHLTKLHFESDVDLHQVSQLGPDGYPGLQVLDLEVDLLHPEIRNVELYVWGTNTALIVLREANDVVFVPAHRTIRRTLLALPFRLSGCHTTLTSTRPIVTPMSCPSRPASKLAA